ncbi:MAG TPA: choice-of-anchor L domain-containing protein [Bacteroidales bacterium]|nr:choice-of-anchor L domain-containing protein [Bacteroidales bacterium]
MKRINLHILFLLLFTSCYYIGVAQTNNLSKDFNSPTVIDYSIGDYYYSLNVSAGESTPLSFPACTRLYQPNNSFYTFTANNSGSFCLEHDFRDSINGGISLFTITNNQINEVYYTYFNTNLLKVNYSDINLAGQEIIAQIWFENPEFEALTHLKLKQYESSNNAKVPAIDIVHYTPEQLVTNVLFSGCLQATNVIYKGSLQSIGYFSNGIPGLDFAEGIILSSGKALDAAGPNNTGSKSSGMGTLGDANLTAMAGMITFDAAVLEFDFQPTGDTIYMEYVFASEEYSEFIGGAYNDVFGFFVSGGPEGYSSVNIAKVPGVDIPVCVNNVNSTTNSEYFVNNIGGVDIQYDGMTVTLTAKLAVTQCGNYHMKIAVADVGDNSYDTGVFLKAGSFVAESDVVMHNYSDWNLGNEIYEGCTNQLVFVRTNTTDLSNPMPVYISIGGTATNGTDYSYLHYTYTIPAGQPSITIPIEAFADGVTEGPETLIITLHNTCPCSTETISITLTILDEIIFSPTITASTPICEGESVTLGIYYSPQPDTVYVVWSNGVTGPSEITVQPSTTTTYTAMVHYPCDSVELSTTVTVYPMPVATASNDGPYCVGDPIHLFSSGGLTYRWRGPNFYMAFSQNPTINNAQLINAGTYQVTVTGLNGCKSIASTYVQVFPMPDFELNAPTPVCSGDPITFDIDTFPDYYYWGPNNWTSVDSFPTIPDADEIHEGWYHVIITDENFCRATDSIFIEVNPSPTATAWSNSPICEGETILLFSDGGPTYSWSGPDGFTSTQQNPTIPNATPANSGPYTITVENIYNCIDTETIDYIVYPTPDASFTNPGPLCIIDPNVTIVAATSGGTWTGTGIINASTGLYSPSGAGIGTWTVTHDLVENGCFGTYSDDIVVNEYLDASINPPAASYCADAAPFNLTATISGGVWSGTGITDPSSGIFNPSTAGAGNHLITYTLTNGACVDVNTVTVVVDALVDATITPAGPFCETGPAVNLSAVSPGGTWSGNGITNASTGTFNPGTANPGIWTITYNVVNGQCSDSDTENITVDSYPNSNWTAIGPFCETDPPVAILPASVGGTWSGTGVNPVTGVFFPGIAQGGTHNITYTIVNGACTSATTKPVVVYDDVDATISPAGPFCVNDPQVTLVAADPGGTWSGQGIVPPSTAGTFSPAGATPGSWVITYSIVNGECSDSDTETILVYDFISAEWNAAGPFCSSDPAVNLVPINPGGTWSGVGIINPVNGTFNPGGAGGGIHDICYTIVNGACTDVICKPIIVYDEADATITSPGPFCEAQIPVILTAADPGGTWSGAWVNPSTGQFNPPAPGTYAITYSINVGACSDSDTRNIVVDLYPNSAITPAGPFCQTDPPVNLTAATGGGTWSGQGITNPSNGTFNPFLINGGNPVITYTLVNGACTSISNTVIHVDALVDATITPDGPFCEFDPAVFLHAVSQGGTWSGVGVAGNMFDPFVAGLGPHTIGYVVINGLCNDSDTELFMVYENADATINGPVGPFCSNDPAVILTAATAGGTWSGPGVNPATGLFTPSTAGPGNHIITYQVTIGTCNDVDNIIIHVDAAVNATITPAGPFCLYDPQVNLSAVSPGGYWEGPGIIQHQFGTFNPTAATVGVHNITYFVQNGVCSDIDDIDIIVNDAPNGTINDPGDFCANDPAVTLTAATPGGTWSGTGITDPNLGIFNPLFANAGENNVCYSISNGPCTTVQCISIYVYDDVADATITSVGPYCVSDGAITLTAVTPGGTWSGDGVIGDLFYPSILPPGNYIITYNVGNLACADSDSEIIHVDDTLSAIINPAGPFCESDAAVLMTAANVGGVWSGPGITPAGTFTPSIAGGGDHVITYTISQGACTNVDDFTVHVDSEVDATITAAGPFCNTGLIQTLTAVSPGGTWSGPGIVDPVVGYFHPGNAGGGNHNICYTVTNGLCSDSDCRIVHVDVYPNTTITPAGPFCVNDPELDLTAATPGGTWSGPGIIYPSVGTFDPGTALAGNHTITYQLIVGACTSTSTTSIHVDGVFDATISPAGPFCENEDTLVLTAATPGGVWSGPGIVFNIYDGIFHPGQAGIGDVVIGYTTVNGECGDYAEITIHIDEYFDATITPAGPFCQNEADLFLTAVDPGGIWSGYGISDPWNGKFSPSLAGEGIHIITNIITNGACTSTDTETIQVDSLIALQITPAGPFCENHAEVTLVANHPNVIWDGQGITNATLGIFTPIVAGPGDHFIDIELTNGVCTSTDTEIIHVDAFPDTMLDPVGPFCENDAAVDLVEPSPGGIWSGPGITAPMLGTFDPFFAQEGTHNICYTIINGECTSFDCIDIEVHDGVDATITSVGPFCYGVDPSLFLTASTPGGTWSGPGIINAVTGLFNPNIANVGSHIICYSVLNGLCSDNDCITIVVESSPDATILTTGPFCEMDGNQIFTAATPGGVWSGPGIGLDGNFNPYVATPGTHTFDYTVSVGSCTSTDQVTIVVDEFFDAEITSLGPFCIYDNPTQLTSLSSGGIWTGTAITYGGLFSPGSAGIGNWPITHCITNGSCSDCDTKIISVFQNPDATITDVANICISTDDFNLMAATPGGIWSGNGITDTVAGTFSPQSAGPGPHVITYTLNINGCNGIDETTITVYPLPVVTISNLETDYCINEPYVYLTVSPGGGFLTGHGISGTIFNPAVAGVGNHTIVYTYSDIHSCTDSAVINVAVHDLPNVSISGIDQYYCRYDGIVNPVMLPVGGVFEGAGTSGVSFYPQNAGTGTWELFYHFTDVYNCTDTAYFTTTVLTKTNPNFNVVQPSCFGYSDGSISSPTTGGLPPYYYHWNTTPPAVTPNITNISVGWYYLTTTDHNDCISVDSIEVTQPTPVAVQITESTAASCHGFSNGSAVAQASGGTPNYTYLWSNPAGTTYDHVYDLSAGPYTVTAYDSHNCSATASVVITEPDTISLDFVNLINPNCYSYCDGTVSVIAHGGTPNYTYQWNDPDETTEPVVSNLCDGVYRVTVTDSHGCIFMDEVGMVEPDSIYFTALINPVICANQLGSAIITVYGGTYPYFYEWSTGEGGPGIGNKPAGIYCVTITDSHNCTYVNCIEIGTIGDIHSAFTQTQDNLCFKDEIADIEAFSVNGAIPMEFEWSNGPTTSQNNNLPAGWYIVTITDSWGCIKVDSTYVDEPDEIQISIFSENVKCRGDHTGVAGITVTGGTPDYHPLWPNGETTFYTITLPAGTIWVTVTDDNGCIATMPTLITQPSAELSINLNITQVSCYGIKDGVINAFAAGGTPSYSYFWSVGGEVFTDPTIRNLDEGEYYLTVVDINNCVADTVVRIANPAILAASYLVGHPSCLGNYDGYIQMATSGGVPPYSYYLFNDIPVNHFIDSLYEGDYYVVVRDSNSCAFVAGPITLVDTDIDCLKFPVAFSPNGDGYNDEWYIENIHLYPKSVVQIYNRWGQLLYEKRGIEGYWDGMYKGKPVPTGVYLYMIILNNDEETRAGTVTVVR